jgi:hypothetical protein
MEGKKDAEFLYTRSKTKKDNEVLGEEQEEHATMIIYCRSQTGIMSQSHRLYPHVHMFLRLLCLISCENYITMLMAPSSNALSDQMFSDAPQLSSAQTSQISAVPRSQKTKMHTSHTIVSQHRQKQVSDWLAERQDFVAA